MNIPGSKQPEKRISANSEVEKKKTTLQKVTTEGTGTRRRTNVAVQQSINALKDNRSFGHKMLGFLIEDLDAKALSENFAEVKDYFKQYKEVGITIPKDILRNFELSGGEPVLGGPAYITEAQAEELKRLAAEGERRLNFNALGAEGFADSIVDLDAQFLSENFAKVKEYFKQYEEVGISIPEDILRNFELLGGAAYITETQAEELKKLVAEGERRLKFGALGPFEHKDIVARVIEQGLSTEDIQSFRSVSPGFSEVPGRRVVLKGSDLLDPKNEKLEFARKNNFPLNIKLDNDVDIKRMIDFLENPANSDLLKNIEVFQWPWLSDIGPNNIDHVNKVLELMSSKCLNLTAFFCRSIATGVSLTFPQFAKLASISCRSIKGTFTLSKLNTLTSFSCGSILQGGTVILSQLDSLARFSCSNIVVGAKIMISEEMPKLQSIDFGTIYDQNIGQFKEFLTLMLSKCPNLNTFTCEGVVGVTLALKQMDRFSSISCRDIFDATLEITQDKKLISFSCGDIMRGGKLILSQLDNLAFCALEDMGRSTEVTLNELDNLTILSFKDVGETAKLAITKLPKIKRIVTGEIYNKETQETLAKYQKQIEKREVRES